LVSPPRRFLDRIKSIEERLLLITNPMSRKGSEIASRIRSMVRREGLFLEETSTDHPDDVGSTLEFWSKRFGGSRVIMVFGGDGAVNQIVNNVMLSRSNKNVVLVPFPGGTANDFCGALGLDTVEKTIEAMISFNVKPIDLIRIEVEQGNGTRLMKYCSNIIGLGIDGDIANLSQKYRRFGVPGYWYAALKKTAKLLLSEPESYLVKIKTPMLDYCGHIIGAMFSNIEKYGQNLRIAPGAKPDDGKIYMTVAKPMSTLRAFIAGLLMLKGKHTKMPGVDGYVCESANVEILDDIYAQEDGEVRFYPRGTFLDLSLEKQAINVLYLPQ